MSHVDDTQVMEAVLAAFEPDPLPVNWLGCVPPNRIPEGAAPSGDPQAPALLLTWSLEQSRVDHDVRFGELKVVFWVEPDLGMRPLERIEDQLVRHLLDEPEGQPFTFFEDDRILTAHALHPDTQLFLYIWTLPYAASGGGDP